MKITDTRTETIFVREVIIGECFEDEGSFYIRLDEYDEEGSGIKCVDISRGCIITFTETYCVKPIAVELRIIR